MSGGRDPAAGQKALPKHGIDIDSLGNGVPLSAAFHRRLHIAKHYRYVNRKSTGAESKEEALAILSKIRQNLMSSDQTGELPEWEQ